MGFVGSPGFIALVSVVSVAGAAMVGAGIYFGAKAVMKSSASLAPAEMSH